METKKEIDKTLKKFGLNKKTKIIIEVDTKFNKFTEKDFEEDGDIEMDLTEDVESDFHRAIYNVIEKRITDGEEFCQEVLEDMESYDMWLPKKVDDFNGLGEISIRISKEKQTQNNDKEEKLEK